MKELLKELGFEHLPMLSKFVDISRLHYLRDKTKEFSDLGYDRSHEMKELMLLELLNYTDLITQPLTKGMFIPCNEEGNVLPRMKSCRCETDKECHRCDGSCDATDYYIVMQQAKERLLFEGWEYDPASFHEVTYLTDQKNLLDFESDGRIVLNETEDVTTIEQAINNGVKLILK